MNVVYIGGASMRFFVALLLRMTDGKAFDKPYGLGKSKPPADKRENVENYSRNLRRYCCCNAEVTAVIPRYTPRKKQERDGRQGA